MYALIVEDDEGIAELVRERLEKFGFETIWTYSASEALDFISLQPIDLLVLDYELPEMNGLELVQKLKSQNIDIPPFIVTTGQGDERVAVEMMKLGAREYIIKDTSFLDVLSKLLNRITEEVKKEILHKKTALKLETTEALQSAILNALDEAFHFVDTDLIVRHTNQKIISWCEKLGLQTELIGKPLKSVFPFLSDNVLQEYEHTLKTGETVITEEETILGTETLFTETHKVGVHYKDNIIGVLTIISDVTERKIAAQEANKFRTISDQAIHGNAISDLDGHLIYINENLANVHGYTAKELIGKHQSIFHTKTQLDNVDKINKALKKNGEYPATEVWHVHKDGTEFPMLMSGTVLRDKNNKPQFYAATAIDISDYKKSQVELQISSEKYKALYENAPLPYQSIDINGDFLDINPAFLDTLGYTREEIINKNFGDFLHPDWKTSFQENFARFKDVGQVQDVHFKMKHKNGHYIDVLLKGLIGYNSDGTFRQTYCVLQDISEQQQVQNIKDAQIRLINYSNTHNSTELLQKFLDEAEELTQSEIGFYHFVENDQQTISLQTWSTNTKENMCKAQGDRLHYPISKAGVWVDCVHEKKPIIHNNYKALQHKKGMPKGHAPVIRELVVPVFRGEQIVAILGVGNKASDYNEKDIKTVQELANLAWETIGRKKTEEELQKSEASLKKAQQIASMGNWFWDIKTNYMYWSEEMYNIHELPLNTPAEHKNVLEKIIPQDKHILVNALESVNTGDIVELIEYRVKTTSGKLKYIQSLAQAIRDNSNNIVSITGTVQDVTTLKTNELKIKENLQEKTVLLEEIHHRVKNNLQIFISLVQMQLRQVNDDVKPILKDIQDRARAMAMVHEKLYESDNMASINIKKYVKDLGQKIIYSYKPEQPISVTYSVDPIHFDIETAITVGLMLNELFTNSIKHAFNSPQFSSKGKKPQISISFTEKAVNSYQIILSDNGDGIPQKTLDKLEATMGLRLIKLWSEGQLNGQLDIKTSPKTGTQFNIVFPKK